MAKNKERSSSRSSETDSLPSFLDGDDNIISAVKIPENPNKKKKTDDSNTGVIEEYVLDFLKDLKANNQKSWMDLNRNVYEGSKENFIEFVAFELRGLQKVDQSLSGITDAKKTLFRINRDTRFSNDKSIYKCYFAAAFSRGSKKDGDAFYYIHIEPNGKSLIAAGIYQPSTAIVTRLRNGIDRNAVCLKESLAGNGLETILGKNVLQKCLIDGKKALKTAPKGFAKDHPEIELLRLQTFTISKTFTDEEVLSTEFPSLVADCLKAFKPFVHCLNSYFDE